MSESINVPLNLGSPIHRWCQKCLLPSALEFPVSVVSVDGVTTVGTQTTCRCSEEK